MTRANHKWRKVVGAATVLFTVCAATAIRSSAQEPAGASAWTGVYTDDQAKRGEEVAGKTCVSCHGPELVGGEAGPALVGLEFLGNWNALSLADLYDRVHATMPADAPGTLTPQQTSDVMSYVLKLNKFPAGTAELSTDMAALKKVTIESQPPAK